MEVRPIAANRSRAPRAPARKGSKKPSTASPESARAWALEWLRSIVIAVALFLVIRTFIVEAFRIPSGSMEDTLLVGDFLLVNKLSYGLRIPGSGVRILSPGGPEHGDIVVFPPPHEPDKNYVKRLVGLAGDTLMMRHGALYRNGERLDEPYARHIYPENDVATPAMLWQRPFLAPGEDPSAYQPTRDNWGPIVVPDGLAFMLGDNRDDSEDSRYWGFVDLDRIKGKPLFIYYSYEASSLRPLPFLTHIRWNRIGRLIR